MVAAWVTHTGVLLHYKVIYPYGSSYDPSDPNALEIGMWNTERMEKGALETAGCWAPRLMCCAETEVILQKFAQMFPGKVGLFTHDNSTVHAKLASIASLSEKRDSRNELAGRRGAEHS